MQKVLEHVVSIPWTPASVKECLWREIQKIMTTKKSTTELTTDEITKIYDVLNLFISENFHVHIPFPSEEERLDLKSKE